MLKIALGCNFYNAREELKRLLDSIPPNFIDYFIGVDGIYKFHKEKYPDMPELSDDGSRELIIEIKDDEEEGTGARKIPHSIIYNCPNALEFEKRNKYLEVCNILNKDIDILLIVDTDEYFIYPQEEDPKDSFARFKKNMELTIQKHKDHNVFSIRALNMNTDPPYDCAYPRIWYKPGEMRYLNGSHYYYGNIYREAKDIETFNRQRFNYVQYSAAMIKGGIVLAHSHNLRTQEYMKQREEYIEYLKRFEGLTQSHYFTLDQSHKLAMLGIDRNEININNKDEIVKKYL